MSEKRIKGGAAYPPPLPPPRRPERPEWGWPSPTPIPMAPTEDIDRMLKQILDRLDTIEKRLERIEKLLMGKQPSPRTL